MPALTAVLLNCTLKASPAVSNTDALMRKVIDWYDKLDVVSEILRVTDYAVKFGTSSNEGDGDEWPLILARIKAADIIVLGMPISLGVRSSVAQMVMERLEGTYAERNHGGQYPLYNKVGGVVVTGNEDGAHSCAESTLFSLSHLGCTIPPNADTYTPRSTRWMAHNTVHLARLLKATPIPPERASPPTEPAAAESDPAPSADSDTASSTTGADADPTSLPRRLFGSVPTESLGVDPMAIEAERRAAEQDRLIDRRRTLDLTRREKGLPEQRNLPRHSPDADPEADPDADPDPGDAPDAGDAQS